MQALQADGIRTGIGNFDGLGVFLTDDDTFEIDDRGDNRNFLDGGSVRGYRSATGESASKYGDASQNDHGRFAETTRRK